MAGREPGRKPPTIFALLAARLDRLVGGVDVEERLRDLNVLFDVIERKRQFLAARLGQRPLRQVLAGDIEDKRDIDDTDRRGTDIFAL